MSAAVWRVSGREDVLVRVIVIGGGSVGANIAFRLAQRGAHVSVLDAGQPGHGTTGTSISWLSSFPQVAGAEGAELRLRLGIDRMFAELAEEIGGGWMHWTGTLTWAADTAVRARLAADAKRAAARGVPVQVLTGREARQAEPLLRVADGAEVYLEESGGWVDAPAMVSALLAAAERDGASVLRMTRAAAIESRDGRVSAVITDSGSRLAGDVVVNAAGSWASHVGALANCPVPVDLRPGLVVYSRPLDGARLGRVLNTPMLNIRPDPSGGVAIHWRGESMYAGHSRNAVSPQQVIDAAARWLPALAGTSPRASRTGIRPVPPGGPIVGPHPSLAGLYVAVSHGGVGWGPVWGKLAASEITGSPAGELDQWRPGRFLASPAELEEVSCA
jgi:glycine/D-amino acid oxidase-like deaminating enzyme